MRQISIRVGLEEIEVARRGEAVQGAIQFILILRIADHRLGLGEIGYRVVALDGEAVLLTMGSGVESERQSARQSD
ncbi:MAG: hypothetical protein E5Y59_06690 [Mesorhizobium sp.]|nr:MAG: hypothetical protein E5Y59_06690 [Mesorhizobium sp.]